MLLPPIKYRYNDKRRWRLITTAGNYHQQKITLRTENVLFARLIYTEHMLIVSVLIFEDLPHACRVIANEKQNWKR